jgi:5-enolpyruvylshikimate-3-phosphate synthase
MAFSLVGLKVPGVAIEDPGVVAKTFADYWVALEAFQEGRDRG